MQKKHDLMTYPKQASPSFRHIQNHTKYVKIARILVPIVAFLLLLFLFWIPKVISPQQFSITDLTQESKNIVDSSAPVLSHPRYIGKSGDWEYDIGAYVANNAFTDSPRIDFISPTGTVKTSSGENFKSQANTGSWLTKKQILELTGNASVLYSNGYYIESDRVQLDIQSQEIRTPGTVNGSAEFGQFKAQKLRIEDNGNTIWLLGKSHVTLMPNKRPKSLDAQKK